MTLVLLLLCAVALALVIHAVYGPRRWYLHVTRELRPGTPEPTDEGYTMLAYRNGWAAVIAVVIMTPVTIDHFLLSEGELYDATKQATSLIAPAADISASRIEAEVEVVLGRDVDVSSVSRDVIEGEDTGTTNYYEVSTKPRSERVRDTDYDPGRNAPKLSPGTATVCVEVTSSRTSEGTTTESIESVDQGRCDKQ